MPNLTQSQRDRKRELEINRAASALAETQKGGKRIAFEQKKRKRAPRPSTLIGYDFETTRIAEGTPRPLYLTAYGGGFAFQGAIDGPGHLHALLTTRFLTEDNYSAKFVAWNGNRFDAYFIAEALIKDPRFRLRPYLTRSKALRGLRVTLAEDGDTRAKRSWEFLDGIAMLGLAGTSLEKFLANFAPDFKKLSGTIDFEREEFDPNNPNHCAYAMRDSEGLYHAMTRAQSILLENFDEPLGVTMGGACIKIFQAHIPLGVKIDPLEDTPMSLIRKYVMRGGFCYCMRRYRGLVWKYDINQAYASAMRSASLPSGKMIRVRGVYQGAKVYIAKVSAFKANNKIPFYYRTVVGGRMRSVFATTEIMDTWLTSIEINQLKSEGWNLDIAEQWFWVDSFNMKDYVDRLERIRMSCEGGPNGPIGTMVKAVGNHSYGKTLESLDPIEFLLAAECPDGYAPFYGDDGELAEFIYYRFLDEPRIKAHHQPHIGAFITAHVRMVLRRVALLAPEHWLYADTDCVVFSCDMTDKLDIDKSRYGAWKIEESGTEYEIIAKKVYTQVAPDSEKPARHAKGLNVKRLTGDDFHRWFEGDAPVQDQIQINNFLAFTRGRDMYRTQKRSGTRIEVNT